MVLVFGLVSACGIDATTEASGDSERMAASALTIASTAETATEVTSTMGTTPVAGDEAGLDGSWKLVSIEVNGQPVEPGQAHVTIEGEEFWGEGACAGIGGRFQLGPDGTIVRFYDIIEDLFGCGEERSAAQEVLLRRLNDTRRYERDGDRLCFMGERVRLCFEASTVPND